MNFMLAGDNNYVDVMIVAMTSILHNHRSREVAFHLFVSGFSEEDEAKLSSSGTGSNSSVKIYRMENYLHHFVNIDPRQSHNPHVSMASNYRLIMTEVLGDDVKKCFYVDSDMVVDCDLSDVYDKMQPDDLAMVVSEIHSMQNRESVLSRLDGWEEFENYRRDPLKYPYFNAGFFLLNVELAKKVDMFSMVKRFIANHDYIPYTDQDILNGVIGQQRPGKVTVLPPHYDVFWNCDHYCGYERTPYPADEVQDAFDHPKVIHYCGPWKPWDCGGWPHYDIWWKYAEMSPVAEHFLEGGKRRLSDLSNEAMRYHYNWGVEKDLQRSFRCIMEVVEAGIGQAVPYAIDTAKELNDGEAIRKLEPYAVEQAEKGNGDCAVRLGQAYRDGQGVNWDLDKAVYWFQKAYDLKVFWCKPEFYDVLKWRVDEYRKKMFEVASSGSDDGNAMSMIQLGRCYRDGLGTEKNMTKAKMSFDDGVKAGADWANQELKELQYTEKGCPFWKK